MAETLSTLSIISFIVAGVAFVVAVFLWVFFRIPRVIGDLSGRNARKSVAKARANNEKSDGKSYRPSATNAARGKLTSAIPQTWYGRPAEEALQQDRPETGLISENSTTGKETARTELLHAEESTEMLGSATASLSETQPAARRREVQGKTLHILEEIMMIHTDEVMR